MDLEFIKSSVRKSRYENEATNLKGIKIPIAINLELVYPNVVREGSVFLLVSRTAIGNPVQKFDLYLEQVCSFKIVNLEEGFDTSRENMQKFISLICHPIALKETQKTLDALTQLYQINPIKLPTSTNQQPQQPNILDAVGKGLPN